MHTIVLGGGIIGVTTAYFLRRHGHEVTVLERQPEVALETSFANGGMMTPSQAEPWNAPGVGWKVLKWLGKEDAPLLLRPRAIPGMVGWGLRFLRHATKEGYAHATAVNVRLARYSLDTLREVRAETGITYDEETRGTMKLFRDAESFDQAVRQSEYLSGFGVAYELLDGVGAVGREPALAPISGGIVGAIYFADDESGDAHKFSQEIARLATADGVAFRFGVAVDGIRADGRRIAAVVAGGQDYAADNVVVALGSYSAPFLRHLKLRLPVHPVKGYSVTAPRSGWNEAPKMPVLDESLHAGVTPMGDRIRMAGTAEFAGFDTTLDARRGQNVIDLALQLYPAFAAHLREAEVTHWAGLRPMTPDGPPILGRTPYENLFINAGQGHLGWTFAPGSGRIVADIVAGQEPDIDLNGLTFDRFL